MQKEYQLDKNRKKWLKKNGKKLSLYWEDTKWKRIIILHLFTWLPFIVALIVAFACHDWIIGYMSGTMLGFCTWIPAGIYFNIFTMNSACFCKYYGEESLTLYDDKAVYKVEYTIGEFCIEEHHMEFDKITRIERNEKLQKVTVFGNYTIPTTKKSEDGRGVTTSNFNYLGKVEVKCVLPMYYKDLDELIQIISEKSNIPVVDVHEVRTTEKVIGWCYTEEPI